MIELRDYQAAGVRAILAGWARLAAAGRRPSVVRQLPTGGGKGLEIAAIVEHAKADGLRVAVIAPGIDLCRQLRARVGCEVHLTTTLASWHKHGKPLPPLDTVIFDEARAITSPGVGPVVDWYLASGARVALFDATPETAQGQGLGAWAEELYQGPSIRELTAAGHLVPTRSISAEPGRGLARSPVQIWGQLWWYDRVLGVKEAAPRLAAPRGRKRRALVFCRDKAHARAEVAAFAAKGGRAAFIGDDTAEKDRAELLGWTDAAGIFHPGRLARGELDALCCASLLRQGIDIPEVELIIVARAFDSEPLARQGWGRGMRTCAAIGKLDCVVADLVGGLFERVGLPDDDRRWYLEGTACRPVGELGMPAIVQCRACGAWGRGGRCAAMVSRNGLYVECGHELPPPPPPRVLARDMIEAFTDDSPEQKARTLTRFVGEAWLSGRGQGKRGKDLIKAGWSGAYRWAAKYPVRDTDGGTRAVKPPPRDVARAIRDVGMARLVVLAWGRILGLCDEGEDMSRSKSGALIKAAARPKSDAGTAGFRAWRDLPPAAAVGMPPIEPVLAAIVAPIEVEAREIAAPPKPESPPRRMAQVDLFDALGVKL